MSFHINIFMETLKMELTVLLTVDLFYAKAEEKEDIFNVELSKREWKKVLNGTPIWKTTISRSVSEESMIKKAKEDLAHAASAAGIRRYGAEIYFDGGASALL